MTHRRDRSLRTVGGRAGRTLRAFFAFAALLGAGLAAPGLSVADVYKWVDENGLTHYTTDPEAIPEHIRGRWKPTPKPAGASEGTSSVEGVDPATLPGPRSEVAPAAEVEEAATLSLPGPRKRPALPAQGEEGSPAALPGPRQRAAPPLPPVQAAPRPAARSELAELERQLARDREAIKKLLSKDAGEEGAWLRDPELRELSERLPRLQAEIEALRRDDEP
jgi:hypothetical protein